MDDIYKNIEEYKQNKKRKILIIFDDVIADVLSNKKFNPIVTELFVKGRKLKNFLALVTQSYFVVPKSIRLNSTHHFIMKIPNKQELQQIVFSHSPDTESSQQMYCSILFFLVTDAALASNNSSYFGENL